MAAQTTKKTALPGGGEGRFKAIIGSGVAGHANTEHIAEIIVFKDRYDALAAGEITNLDAYTIGEIIAAAFSGG